MPFSVPQPSGLDRQLSGTDYIHIGTEGRTTSEHQDVHPTLLNFYIPAISPSLPTVDETDSEDNTSDVEAHLERTVLQLARTFTSESHAQHYNPFSAQSGSSLDPQGSQFSGKEWASAFYRFFKRDADATLRSSGLAFRNLNVHGYGTAADFQKTVANVFLSARSMASKITGRKGERIQILQDFEGVLQSGEMLCVLGPPGSGCSTFLRTIAGETHGFTVDHKSYMNYKGITPKEMKQQYRGEAIYSAEVDAHFPMLTVGDTLYFAALARAPQNPPGGISRKVYAKHMRDVVMAVLGISHTVNTRVGDNYVRGVSGGERKRVSIAEALLSDGPLQCWDNSTRGLDSGNAVEFCRTLRTSADIFGATSAVAIYQAPQDAYDLFDKVILLYGGRQIFFGRTGEAREYFESLGFQCPQSQTTADFLTSMTSANERVIRTGFEGRAPRTPDDFANAWKQSEHRKLLLQEIETFSETYPFHGKHAEEYAQSRRQEQSKHSRTKSPYTMSYAQQIKLCLWRGFVLLKGDPSVTIIQLIMNFIQFLVISSIFYNLPQTTDSLFRRGVLVLFAILLSAFASVLEILTLYAKRPIVEKHNRYALYHPSAEAIAAMITDLPYKIVNCIICNVTLYFMTNLNRTPGPFFFYLLISFSTTLTMSMVFRFMGAITKTVSQALAPTTIMLLAFVLFTGFSIPTEYMLGWSRWINYVNPVAYSFESLLINELSGREFFCSTLVPSGPDYDSASLISKACAVIGSVPGADFVGGTRYLEEAFDYRPAHKWRNFGILLAFMIFFFCCALVASELVSSARSKGEVLIFPRGKIPKFMDKTKAENVESGSTSSTVKIESNGSPPPQKKTPEGSVFHWRDVCYDVKVKSDTRRILDHVCGWVKPGTLTALMGVSGAGKTTLLDALADRLTMGVITGDMLVDGKLRDDSFQRKTGYVQQQDLHLSTATVREALIFSALLRQPASTSKQEKLGYVEEVIDLLEMREYSDAVIGELGEGLNVEQRKRLSIGVELAARPQLLLFLDEPTSGLDSQTSWSVCDLMRKLVDHGQAILCTIHQPSAMLFQRFDRLLLLAKGGRTVYFGDIGHQSHKLVEYFTQNGASPPSQGSNPAEWILELVGKHATQDWPEIWLNSPEKKAVDTELSHLEDNNRSDSTSKKSEELQEFAAPFSQQLFIVTKRVFQQYWRSPSYIWSKGFLTVVSSIFIGFSFFKAGRTQQGLQNQLFAVFALLTIFTQLAEQTMPFFVVQRALYEVRERPSKTYSWKAFMISAIAVEIPWNLFFGTFTYICWWFPAGFYRNAEFTGSENYRSALAFLFICLFMLLASTFSHLCIAGISSEEAAGNIANVLGLLLLLFCGVIATPQVMPGFWIFMYRCNPFTYLVGGLMATALARAPATCAANEVLVFQPESGSGTCGQYMSSYISNYGGVLSNPNATQDCQYCRITETDTFLSAVNISFDSAWRNWGIIWAFIMFNAVGAVLLYWIFRVPKKTSKKSTIKDTRPSAAGEKSHR